MNSVWKWVIGIAAVLLLLAVLSMPLMMFGFGPGGYGMMNGPRWGWHMPMLRGWMPMMAGGFGWMGMLLSGLIQLGILVLIVLGIIWLVRAIARQDQKSG